ncbi:hypothetical protein FBU30_009325 [Linnemannia zychae]|nr:hypothetical protein FBU30_009325 [Linnemannia zychae]
MSSSSSVPYRSSRWPARFVMWTGIGHNIVGLLKPALREPLFEAVNAGYINQFTTSMARSNSLWFFITGFNLMMLSRVIDWYLFPEDAKQLRDSKGHPKSSIYSDKILPRELGYWFLGLGVFGACAMPKSGFYLMVAQGAALLLSK